MPLPWKKIRVTPISQLVADLQVPKRGCSLVVQPGFPTSLIDLFVKNREHLKKSSKKTKSKKRTSLVNAPITENSELGSSNSAVLEKPSSQKIENLSDHGVEDCGFCPKPKTVVEDGAVGDEECRGGSWSGVFLAVMKMFVVVVLALSTKKLAVGITLSAFVLLFFEFAGKHLACLFKPCSNAKAVFQNMGRSVFGFMLCLNCFDEIEDLKAAAMLGTENGDVVFELVDTRSEEIRVDESGGERNLIELLGTDYEKRRVVEKGSRVGEKTMVELLGMDYEKRKEEVVEKRRGVCSDKTLSERSLVKLLGTDYEKIRGVVVVEEGAGRDGGEVVGDKKSKGGKNSKIKSKLIKKFVPKKLRRKGKQNEQEPEPAQSSEVSSYVVYDKVEGSEEVEDHKDVEQESENISVFSLGGEEKSEIQGFDGVSDHGEGSVAGGETPLIVERKGREGEGNFGYLILFLVVLAGLFGGRIVALLLTITCCFMPKLAGCLRRWIKVCP